MAPGDLDRWRAGDPAFVRFVWERSSARLRARVRRYARDTDEAEDLLQDCWLRALEHRAAFTGRGSLDDWLARVCERVWLAALRARARERGLAATVRAEAEDAYTVSDAELERLALRRQDRGDDVTTALLRLPRGQRLVGLCRWMLGWSVAETAEQLGVAPGTVKAALHAARERIRRRMAEIEREDAD